MLMNTFQCPPQTSPKLQELYQYMCLAAPFGTPMDTNPTTIRHHLQHKGAKAASSPKLKVPHCSHSLTHSLTHHNSLLATLMETNRIQRKLSSSADYPGGD